MLKSKAKICPAIFLIARHCGLTHGRHLPTCGFVGEGVGNLQQDDDLTSRLTSRGYVLLTEWLNDSFGLTREVAIASVAASTVLWLLSVCVHFRSN